MLTQLRFLCDRQSVTGGTLPTIRELSSDYGVSTRIAHSVLQALQKEGLVSSTRGSGTTVVTRRFSKDEVFLYAIVSRKHPHILTSENRELLGFTDRMAELGALVLSGDDSTGFIEEVENNGVQCRGMFANTWDPILSQRRLPLYSFPVVGFLEHSDPSTDDSVRWDDESGGRLATEHLLSFGHESVAFIGAFGQWEDWSVARATGYQAAMDDVRNGSKSRILEFDVPRDRDDDLIRMGEESARILWDAGLPNAVVAANDLVAVSFLRELSRLECPLIRWPAIMGFDDELKFCGQPISSMRMDNEIVGRAAADLLWKRTHGQLTGPPTVTRLPPRLVPRVTSQPGWAYRLHRIFAGFPSLSVDNAV